MERVNETSSYLEPLSRNITIKYNKAVKVMIDPGMSSHSAAPLMLEECDAIP